MSIPYSVYTPDATLYASYSQNLVYDIQKALFALNSTVAAFTNGLLTQDVYTNRPSAGTSGRIYYATDLAMFFYDNGTNWVNMATMGLITVSRYANAAGNHTFQSNCIVVHAIGIGAGGSGSGAAATDGTHHSIGGGGGGGGISEGWFLNPRTTPAYNVPAQTAGTSGAAGSTGGNTTFGTWVTANGGLGGSIVNAIPNTATNGTQPVDGGTATWTGGIIGVPRKGSPGQPGLALINTCIGGNGGHSYGGGGVGVLQATGGAGSYGGGGGGAANTTSQAARTGGAGASGVLIVEEFG